MRRLRDRTERSSGLVGEWSEAGESRNHSKRGLRGPDARCISGASSDHLVEGSLVDERSRRPRVEKGAAFEPRHR